MKKIILFILISTFMYSQTCHYETGWCYDVTTFQCFYMPIIVTIDDELAAYEEDNNDVVGAFCGDTMVGFAWATESYTTVPAMGNDGNFPTYCSGSDVPIFKIYDASEDIILDAFTLDEVPSWANGNIFILDYLSASTTPDCSGDIGGSAFIDDCGNCVGGNTGMEENWAFDECGECYGDNYSCSGCTDPCASNYDEGSIIDDGSCMGGGTTVYYNLLNVNNLIGYNGSAESITDAIPDQFEDYIVKILGEGVATQQLTPGNWVGSLSELKYGYGYWIEISQDIEGFYFE